MEKKPIRVYMPRFERTEKLDYETPKTKKEFIDIVGSAPTDILFGFGFRKWSTMNNCIKENIVRNNKPQMFSLPTVNIDDLPDILEGKEPDSLGSVLMDLTPEGNIPLNLLTTDCDIWLFPHEWYDIIPDGFIVTGLYGEQFQFEKGKTDNDRRFGCLGYGIMREIIHSKKTN